jgi:hypothetical protein
MLYFKRPPKVLHYFCHKNTGSNLAKQRKTPIRGRVGAFVFIGRPEVS